MMTSDAAGVADEVDGPAPGEVSRTRAVAAFPLRFLKNGTTGAEASAIAVDEMDTTTLRELMKVAGSVDDRSVWNGPEGVDRRAD